MKANQEIVWCYNLQPTSSDLVVKMSIQNPSVGLWIVAFAGPENLHSFKRSL